MTRKRTTNPTRWYFSRDGEVIGTVGEDRIREVIREGTLLPDDRVMRVGGSEWRTAANVPLFARLFLDADDTTDTTDVALAAEVNDTIAPPAMSGDAPRWFIRRAGRTVGPVSTVQVVAGTRDGKLRPDDGISEADDGPWDPLWTVHPFSLAFGSAEDSDVWATPIEMDEPEEPSTQPDVFGELGEERAALTSGTSSALQVELPDDLLARIDGYVARLREELPGLEIDRETAARVLIAKGLDATGS